MSYYSIRTLKSYFLYAKIFLNFVLCILHFPLLYMLTSFSFSSSEIFWSLSRAFFAFFFFFRKILISFTCFFLNLSFVFLIISIYRFYIYTKKSYKNILLVLLVFFLTFFIRMFLIKNFFVRIFFIRIFFIKILFPRILFIRIRRNFYIVNNIRRNIFFFNSIFTFF